MVCLGVLAKLYESSAQITAACQNRGCWGQIQLGGYSLLGGTGQIMYELKIQVGELKPTQVGGYNLLGSACQIICELQPKSW